MDTELRIVRLEYSVIEMLSIVQLQFYAIRKKRQQKNKTAHPKRVDGFMVISFR